MTHDTDGDNLAAHPDLAGTGASMREEWRTEQEAATRDAAESWQHRRTLVDLVTEHMHRGDRLAVTVAGQRFAGVPEEVGEDLIALRTLFGRVDIHITSGVPLWYEIFERAATGGGRGSNVAGGRFHTALTFHEHDSEASVGTMMDPDGLDGKLTVGKDHVRIVARAGAETVIPLQFVAWVSPRRQ
jgi:hypothetical protein